jgi:large repetitive protein
VTVNKSADPVSGTAVTAGQTINYTLSVEVSDSATTDAVVLTDTLGAGLTLDAGSLPIECGAVGQVVTCTLASGSLPGSYTFEYERDG